MSGSTGGGGSLGCCLQHAVLAYHGIVQSFWQALCVYCGQLCAACYAVGCVWVAAIALCLVLGKHELANYLCNVCEPVWLVSASIRAQQNAHKVVAVSASFLAMLLAVCVCGVGQQYQQPKHSVTVCSMLLRSCIACCVKTHL